MIWSERVIQRVMAAHLEYYQCKLFPNVAFAGGECDLLQLRKSGFLVEYEIKISTADWNNDQHKDKWASPDREKISRFFYVVPKHLMRKVPLWLPPTAGIISLELGDRGRLAGSAGPRYWPKVEREAGQTSKYKATPKDIEHLMASMYYRFWAQRMKDLDRL